MITMRSHQGTLRLLLCIALTIGFPIALWCSGDVDCCDVGETLQPRHPLFFNGGDYFTEIVWGDPNGITDSMWCEPGIDYLFIFHPTLVEDDGYGLGDLDYCVRSNNSIGGIHNFFYDDKMDSFSTTIGFITEADPGNEVSVRITHDGGNPLLSVLSLTMTEPALCDSDDPTGNTDKRTIRLWRGPYFDNSPQEFVFTEVFVVLWQNEILPANPGPLGVWNPSITIHERFENRNGQILFPPDGIQATYDSSMPPPYVVLDGYGFPRCDFRYTAPSGGWYCIPVEDSPPNLATLDNMDQADGDRDGKTFGEAIQVIEWYHGNLDTATPNAIGWYEMSRWPLRQELDFNDVILRWDNGTPVFDPDGGEVVFTATRDNKSVQVSGYYYNGVLDLSRSQLLPCSDPRVPTCP